MYMYSCRSKFRSYLDLNLVEKLRLSVKPRNSCNSYMKVSKVALILWIFSRFSNTASSIFFHELRLIIFEQSHLTRKGQVFPEYSILINNTARAGTRGISMHRSERFGGVVLALLIAELAAHCTAAAVFFQMRCI